jgi:hypothetical protein
MRWKAFVAILSLLSGGPGLQHTEQPAVMGPTSVAYAGPEAALPRTAVAPVVTEGPAAVEVPAAAPLPSLRRALEPTAGSRAIPVASPGPK